MFQKYSRKPQSKIHWHVSCVLLLTIVLSFVAGCSDKKNDSQTELDNTLYLGTYQKPEPFIYPMITGGITQSLMDVVFDRLFLVTAEGRLIPQLSDKWEILDSGKKFIIHLRNDVQFHDGTKFTSRDVAFTLNWFRNPDLSNRFEIYSNIETISVLNNQVVEITLKNNNVNFLQSSLGYAYIYPAHLFSKSPSRVEIEKFGKYPIGTGPYQFSSWEEGNTLTFIRNPGYFGGTPFIERIVVKPYSSKLHLFNAFVRGDVDLLERLDSQDYETIHRDASFHAVKEIVPGGHALMFNFKSPVFSDARLRRAVSMGLRRNEMIEILEKGNGEPMKSPLSGTLGQEQIYEPEKAEELIKLTGRKSISMKLIVEGSNAKQMMLAKIIRNQLNEIGIDVNIVPLSGLDSVASRLKGSGDWDVLLFFYQCVLPYHAGVYLRSQFAFNIGGYSNSNFDAGFKKLETQPDFNQQKKILIELDESLRREVPVCLLYTPVTFSISAAQIQSFKDEEFSSAYSSFLLGMKEFKKNERR